MVTESNNRPVLMVVDDQEQSVGLRKRLFESMGFTVFGVQTIREALTLVDQHPDVDVVLTDIHFGDVLNDRSGIEFARALKARPNPPIVVGYSSIFTEAEISPRESENFDLWSAKGPINADDLLRVFEDIRELAVWRRSTKAPDMIGEQLSSTLVPIQFAWDELCRYLARHPNYLHQMEPRRFEELIAEMFRSHGWVVELTARTRDGGHDIVAVKNVRPSGFRVLIEAKRWSPERPVGVGVVRALYGLHGSRSASKLILATSSTVSTVSKLEFQRVIPWELDFIERQAIIDWCKAYPRVKLLGDLA